MSLGGWIPQLGRLTLRGRSERQERVRLEPAPGARPDREVTDRSSEVDFTADENPQEVDQGSAGAVSRSDSEDSAEELEKERVELR